MALLVNLFQKHALKCSPNPILLCFSEQTFDTKKKKKTPSIEPWLSEPFKLAA